MRTRDESKWVHDSDVGVAGRKGRETLTNTATFRNMRAQECEITAPAITIFAI